VIRRLRLLAMGEFDVLAVIGRDPAATMQAAAISSVSFALLAILVDRTFQAVMLGAVIGIFGLGAWSVLLWATGRLVGSSATPVGLLRGIGYVAPPLAFTPIPILGITAGIGCVALQVVAMKQIGRISTPRAATAVVPPWLAFVLFGMAVRAIGS
jgi:hypothetical protein